MDNERDNNNSKQILLSVLGVAILIVAVVGISFAAFTYSKAGTTTNTITTGTISMSYNESENGISIENAIPMTAEQGKLLSGNGNVFDFNVTASITGDTTINYEVVAAKDVSSTIPDENVRLYLEKSSTEGSGFQSVAEPAAFKAIDATNASGKDELGAPNANMLLHKSTFTGSSTGKVENTEYYRLRMWVDESYNVGANAGSYTVRVGVYGKGTN